MPDRNSFISPLNKNNNNLDFRAHLSYRLYIREKKIERKQKENISLNQHGRNKIQKRVTLGLPLAFLPYTSPSFLPSFIHSFILSLFRFFSIFESPRHFRGDSRHARFDCMQCLFLIVHDKYTLYTFIPPVFFLVGSQRVMLSWIIAATWRGTRITDAIKWTSASKCEIAC